MVYGDKVYTNFRGSNVAEDGVERESFTKILFIYKDSLLAYENTYYKQVYLENCAYKTEDKKMTFYVDDKLFETDED